MTWNDVISNLREKLRRRTARHRGESVPVLAGGELEQLSSSPLRTPPVDVFENEREFLIHADVPGGNRHSATVAWDAANGLTLLVKGTRLSTGSHGPAEEGAVDWYRALPLPEYVDGLRASSSIRDGVLTVRVPKRNVTPKLIPVRAG
jgi:HSP20 family molecular chaperone IbpA